MYTVTDAVSAAKEHISRMTFLGRVHNSTAAEYVLEQVPCPGCQTWDANLWAKENGYSAVKCIECGMIYVNPRPKISYRSESVKTGKYRINNGVLDVRGMHRSKRIANYRKMISQICSDIINENKPIRWLDIGAGHGEMVLALQQVMPPHSSIEGIEPNEGKVRSARSRGINISQKDLTDITDKYDIVSLINVYSHLPYPCEFIADARQRLQDGGNILILTGNAADIDIRDDFPNELYLPDHLVFTGEAQLRDLLYTIGFDDINITYERYDTVMRCLKSVVKRMIGRPAGVVFPGSSKFKFMWVRGRLRT